MKQQECSALEKKERQKAYLKQWRVENPDKRKAQRVREYQNSREKLLQYAEDYRKANPDSTKAAQKRWAASHREYINKASRDRYLADTDFSSRIKTANSARHKRLRRSIPVWQDIAGIKSIFLKKRRRFPRGHRCPTPCGSYNPAKRT